MSKSEIIEEMRKTKLELEHYEDLLYRQILNDAYGKQANNFQD